MRPYAIYVYMYQPTHNPTPLHQKTNTHNTAGLPLRHGRRRGRGHAHRAVAGGELVPLLHPLPVRRPSVLEVDV